MAGQRIVAAGRVEHDEIGIRAHCGGQRIQFFHAVARVDRKIRGGQRNVAPPLRLGAIFQIAVQCALPAVEIDRGHPRALIGQRDGAMHGGGGFARAAFFVGKHDAVWAVRHNLFLLGPLGGHRRLNGTGCGARPDRL